MNPIAFVIVVATLGMAYVAATSWSVRQRALRRLYADQDEQRLAVAIDPSSSDSWFAR